MRRSEKGTFIPRQNRFEIVGDLVYCYEENGELLFFTDDMRVMDFHWGRMANGYASSQIDGIQVSAHRFISKPRPDELVDHINRNKKDDRICNLRNTNKSMNAFNCAVRKNNKSGKTGVYFRRDTKRWCAEIRKDYKKIVLGCFDTYEEAVAARKKAERTYYGDQ